MAAPVVTPLEGLLEALKAASLSAPLEAPLAALLEALAAAPLAVPQQRRHGLPPGTQALLDIEKDPGLSAALKSLESQEQYLGAQHERILTRKAELNTDIFNIVGFFSVFQGVILTAVSSLKSDTYSTCKIIHWPIILTCLATFAAIVAFLMKWSLRRDIERVIDSNRHLMRDIGIQSRLLKYKGSKYEYEERQSLDRPRQEGPLFIKMILVILAMLLFSGVFIMAYCAILCDRLVFRKWEGGF